MLDTAPRTAELLSREQRRQLTQNLETLLNEIRYEGLLPSSGIATDDIGETRAPLHDKELLLKLTGLVSEIDIEGARQRVDALLFDTDLPFDTDVPIDTEMENENAESSVSASPADLGMPALFNEDNDKTLNELFDAEETITALASRPVQADELELNDSATTPEAPANALAEAITPSETAEVQTLAMAFAEPTPEEAAIERMELAQALCVQLMTRLDDTLAEQYPEAVYLSFADFYFQFSAKICDRLAETEREVLLNLLAAETARKVS